MPKKTEGPVLKKESISSLGRGNEKIRESAGKSDPGLEPGTKTLWLTLYVGGRKGVHREHPLTKGSSIGTTWGVLKFKGRLFGLPKEGGNWKF